MIKKFLKIQNIKRFAKWLDRANVHAEIRETYFNMPYVMYPNERKGIEARLESTSQRDAFCFNLSKIRPTWKDCFTRYGQYKKANQLVEYVKKRYLRDRKKKMLDRLIDKKLEKKYG